MIELPLGPDKSIGEDTNMTNDLRLAPKSPFPYISPPTTLRPEHPVSFGPRNLKYSSLYSRVSGYNFDQLSQNQVQVQNPYLGFKDHVAAGLREVPNEYVSMRRRNPIKTCHYHIRGFCKYRDNCKFLHDESIPRSFSPALRGFSNNEDHDQIFPPGSLEKLEIEIVDILKSRRGPISIASLPMIYLERYSKSLQADGYLTESQRHGKTGHSLTRLLSKISSITLIDRFSNFSSLYPK